MTTKKKKKKTSRCRPELPASASVGGRRKSCIADIGESLGVVQTCT